MKPQRSGLDIGGASVLPPPVVELDSDSQRWLRSRSEQNTDRGHLLQSPELPCPGDKDLFHHITGGVTVKCSRAETRYWMREYLVLPTACSDGEAASAVGPFWVTHCQLLPALLASSHGPSARARRQQSVTGCYVNLSRILYAK